MGTSGHFTLTVFCMDMQPRTYLLPWWRISRLRSSFLSFLFFSLLLFPAFIYALLFPTFLRCWLVLYLLPSLCIVWTCGVGCWCGGQIIPLSLSLPFSFSPLFYSPPFHTLLLLLFAANSFACPLSSYFFRFRVLISIFPA